MSEWRERNLGAVVAEAGGIIRTGPFGSQLHSHEYIDGGPVKVAMPKDMVDGRLSNQSMAGISAETASRLREHLLEAGDIVLARRGDIGRAAWVERRDGPVICGTGSMRIHFKDGALSARYLHYFLQTELAIDWLRRRSVGATMPNLNAAIVGALPIRYPGNDSQQRVIAILDALDDLMENKRRRIELLERMAQSIYREWFASFRYPDRGRTELRETRFGLLPDGWTWTTLGAAARWFSGGTPSTTNPDYWDGGIPWITSGSLTSLLLDRSERTLTEAGLEAKGRIVPRDALLFVVRGMSLVREFRVGIADRPVSFGQDCKALVANEGIEPLFLAFAVIDMAADIQGMVELAGHGTGKLSTDRLRAIVIPQPPDDLQRLFAAKVGLLREMMSRLRASSDRLVAARELLLPKLVTGQIDVSKLDLDGILGQAAA